MDEVGRTIRSTHSTNQGGRSWTTDGRRPVYGSIEKFQGDPEWRDLLQFHEYFHGDTGAGLGASHQTGWTGLVARLLCRDGVLDRDRTRDPAEVATGSPPAASAVR